MENWVIPCNTTTYDVVRAFQTLKKLDWKQSTNVEVGAFVYIYVGAPISAIKFKCKAIVVDKTESTIDDSAFVIKGEVYDNYGRYMCLELMEEYPDDLYPKDILLANGLNTIQGPSKVTDRLEEFMSQDFNAKKYTVIQAVWIAAALMACEEYENNSYVKKQDMYFKNSEIVKRAQSLTEDNVDNARVSWWCCADAKQHTYNFLRGDNEKDKSLRRLSCLSEFPTKTIPDGLNKNDLLEMNGHVFTMEELIVFVKEQYPSIVMPPTNINYLHVLEYLENNLEVPYSNPNAPGVPPAEKERLLQIKKEGQEAIAEMKKMATLCNERFGLDKCEPMSWLDGSRTKTRKYLWAQMKFSSYAAKNESISIFADMASNPKRPRYRISLEINNDKSDKAAMDTFHKFLELPLDIKHQLTYASGSNEYGHPFEFSESQAQIKEKVADGTYNKVQICRILERTPNSTNESFEQGLLEAVAALIPYYEYVLGKNTSIPITNEDEYWPPLSEYDPGIDAAIYEKLLVSACSHEHLDVLYYMYKMGGAATCKQIAAKYGNTYSHYLTNANNISKNVARETGCELSKRENGSAQYWPVLFVGKDVDDRADGVFQWKLREPLKEAVKNLAEKGVFEDMNTTVAFDHNMILYGPPGTGKTYYTTIYAVAIADNRPFKEVESEAKADYQKILNRYNELKKEERIAFTTFHQSYGYEEFIEGIKPNVEDSMEEVGYSIEDGVFKAFCKSAEIPKIENIDHSARVWKVTLKQSGDSDLKKECFADGTIKFDWKRLEECAGTTEYYWVDQFANKMKVGDIVVSYSGSATDIDGVAVVTGENEYDKSKISYRWKRTVKWLYQGKPINIKELNGNTYLSGDQIYCLRRVKIGELLKRVQPQSYKSNDKNYVFIIDEINRGNISKIFGELITLIEETKRKGADEEMSAVLPYSTEPFSVPSNVYILGTMNTADRSIALMDTALRRRFQFIEMMPNPQVLNDMGANVVIDKGQTLDVAKMLEIINKRIEYLYDREHTIGHAFFTKLKDDPTVECLGNIFQKSVVPLLQEYFYEDYNKIQLVLGDNDKDDKLKFIKDSSVEDDIFNGYASDISGLPERKYEIQTESFMNIQSYKKIHKSL